MPQIAIAAFRAGRRLGAATLFSALTSAGAAVASPERPFVNPDLVAELIFGAYCAEEPVRTEEAPGTVAGVVNIVPRLPDIRFVQQVVPAAIDIGFGVLVRGQPGPPLTPVTVTITHPPFRGTGRTEQTWETSLDGDALGLIGFSFDTDEELVLGDWRITVTKGETMIFDVPFEIVPPGAARAVVSTCLDGNMS